MNRSEVTGMVQDELDAETIAAWRSVPTIVRDRHFTVVAANDLAVALSPDFAPGSNIARAAFLPAQPREATATLADSLGNLVALLREQVERTPDDARFVRLVGELAALSSTFAELWADDSVTLRAEVPMSFPQPNGMLDVVFDETRVAESSDLVVVAMRPAEGPSRHRFDRFCDAVAYA